MVGEPKGRYATLGPPLLAAGLVALAVFGPAREHPALVRTLVTTAIALGGWNLALIVRARRGGRTLSLQAALKAQHYLQACAQASVLVYWGWYWRPVYDYAHLIVAQLLFAYAFDMLLSGRGAMSTRSASGRSPSIFSINLFLWFRPDWFYLPVPDGGPRLRRQGADALGQGRAARAHLQPVVVSAGGVLAGAAAHAAERPHLGPGDRDHAVLSAAHVPDSSSSSACRASSSSA